VWVVQVSERGISLDMTQRVTRRRGWANVAAPQPLVLVTPAGEQNLTVGGLWV